MLANSLTKLAHSTLAHSSYERPDEECNDHAVCMCHILDKALIMSGLRL